MLELPKKCGCICADGVLPEAALMDIGLPQMIMVWMPPICQTAFLMGLDYMMRHAHNYEGCPHKSTITEDLSDFSEPRYDLNVSNLSFCKYGLTRHLRPHMHRDWQRICVSKVGGRGRGRYILGIRYSGAGILGIQYSGAGILGMSEIPSPR